MLFDDASTVDADNFPVGEGLADDVQGFGIEVGLSVSGTEHSAVDDEEIGIGSGEPVSVFVDRTGHGQFHETVGLAVDGAESSQLRFHQPQFFVLLVFRVVATYI